jgi:hypothetical protein
MIHIGTPHADKHGIVKHYCQEHGIQKVVAISPKQFPLTLPGADNVEYDEVIMYRTFYRLLREVDGRTLIVLSECLRTQNRYELAYNCIRNFLNQTTHQIIFQQLPQIDTREDFMILFDFDTRSRWKRRPFDPALIRDNAQVVVRPLPVAFGRVDVPTSARTRAKYQSDRDKLFDSLGARDPHIIPRNLYLIGGQDKAAWVDAQGAGQLSLFGGDGRARQYVARNQRLKRDNIVSYADATAEDAPYTIVELPHRFIDFCDFVQRTGQAGGDVLVADLKVDRWYYGRYAAWAERIHATYADLRR